MDLDCGGEAQRDSGRDSEALQATDTKVGELIPGFFFFE